MAIEGKLQLNDTERLQLKKQFLKVIALILKDRGEISNDKYMKMIVEFEKIKS